MSVAEAQARVSSREFAEWQAFLRVEPQGGGRLDVWMASLMAMLANLHRDPKARRRAYRVKDFWPEWWKPRRARRDWRDLKALVEALNAAFGGADKRRKRA